MQSNFVYGPNTASTEPLLAQILYSMFLSIGK